MKKLVFLIVLVVLFTGCEKVSGNFNEGTYFGFDEFESYGNKFVTTAVVYVDSTGEIKSVFIDSTYNKNGVNTTKKVLGNDYGMKARSAEIGAIENGAEWFEQIEVLEDKIVSEQGLDWIEFTDEEETTTDSVAGVTITIDSYYNAVNNAIEKAKK